MTEHVSFDFTIVESKTGKVLSVGTTMSLVGIVPTGCEGIIRRSPKEPGYYTKDAEGAWAEFKFFPMSPDPAFEFNYTTEQWEDQRDVGQARVDKWAQIKRQRNLLEVSGFPYMGKMLDSDPVSVQRITTAAQAVPAEGPFEITWTTADNSPLVLDGPGMLGMPAALATYAAGLHATAAQLRQAIEAAKTRDEVMAISWPQSVG